MKKRFRSLYLCGGEKRGILVHELKQLILPLLLSVVGVNTVVYLIANINDMMMPLLSYGIVTGIGVLIYALATAVAIFIILSMEQRKLWGERSQNGEI